MPRTLNPWDKNTIKRKLWWFV